jgi:hypothetical protein
MIWPFKKKLKQKPECFGIFEKCFNVQHQMEACCYDCPESLDCHEMSMRKRPNDA